MFSSQNISHFTKTNIFSIKSDFILITIFECIQWFAKMKKLSDIRMSRKNILNKINTMVVRIENVCKFKFNSNVNTITIIIQSSHFVCLQAEITIIPCFY